MIVRLFPELAQKCFLVVNKKLCFVDSRLADWIHATTARSKQASSTTPTRRARASVDDAARVAWRKVDDGGGVLFFTALDRLCVVVDSEYLLHGSNYKGFLSMVKHQYQKDFPLSRGCCRSRCSGSVHALRDTRWCVLCYPKNQLPIHEPLTLRHPSNP